MNWGGVFQSAGSEYTIWERVQGLACLNCQGLLKFYGLVPQHPELCIITNMA